MIFVGCCHLMLTFVIRLSFYLFTLIIRLSFNLLSCPVVILVLNLLEHTIFKQVVSGGRLLIVPIVELHHLLYALLSYLQLLDFLFQSSNSLHHLLLSFVSSSDLS